MSDHDGRNSERDNGDRAISEAATRDGQGADAGNRPSQRPSAGALHFLGQLNTNERLTAFLGAGALIIGVGSLVVSYQTYRVASDTSDIKNAINHLSDLASQTKRQADLSVGQLAQVKREADALNGQLVFLGQQVQEAKDQTHAISQQTDAIRSSAASAIKLADAQSQTAQAEIRAAQQDELAARAAAQANLPTLALTGFDLNGINDAPGKDGNVGVTVHPVFTNSGGSMFGNFGALSLSPTMPDKVPDYGGAGFALFGGNEISVAHGGTFYPQGTMGFQFPASEAKAIGSGQKPLFAIGRLSYTDAARHTHQWCFAYAIVFAKDQPAIFYPVGAPEWHCQT